MKKIEKQILLMDYENAINQYERRITLLDNIIVYYNEEEVNKHVYNDTDETNIVKRDNDVEEFDDDNVDEKNKEQENGNYENNEEQEVKEEETKVKEDLLPKEIKDLYRKIMMVTHPDKVKNKINQKEYEELYKKAVKAKSDNNKSEIIYIAYKLNIKEVFNIDSEHFGNIKYNIAKYNIDIKNIENSPYWVWYYTDNESLRKIINLQIKKFR